MKAVMTALIFKSLLFKIKILNEDCAGHETSEANYIYMIMMLK